MDLALTDGDISFGDADGAVEVVTGAAELAQRLELRLDPEEGEWPLDLRLGLPWRTQIRVKNPSLAVVDALLRRKILETPGVRRIADFNLEHDAGSRTLTVTFRAITGEGSLEMELEL